MTALAGVIASDCMARSTPSRSDRVISDSQEKSYLWRHVGHLLETEQFAVLDFLAANLRRKQSRFRSGDWRLEHFYVGLERGSKTVNTAETTHYLPTIEAWLDERPNSLPARIALARAHQKRAWEFRGTGFASAVPEKAWPKFRKHLNKALDLLQSAKATSVDDPQFYRLWIDIARASGAPKKEQIALCKKGIEIEPQYHPLYYAVVFTLLPKWGGSAEEIAKFAMAARQHVGEELHAEFYARMAAYAAESTTDKDFFHRFLFSWQLLDQGQRDIERRYPKSRRNLNRRCWFSAAANRQKAAKDCFKRLAPAWNKDKQAVWGQAARCRVWRDWAWGKRAFPAWAGIHLAASQGDLVAVIAHLKKGANIDQKGGDGDTPLMAAMQKYREAVAFELVKRGANIAIANDGGNAPLHVAATHGFPQLAAKILMLGGDPNHKNRSGVTPLQYAAYYGRPAIIKMLLKQKNIDVNAQDKDGKSALRYAAGGGRIQIVKMLLKRKELDVNPRDRWKRTPLHEAAHFNHAEIVRLLMRHGAFVNPRNFKGNTPLNLAKRKGHRNIVKRLKKHGGQE